MCTHIGSLARLHAEEHNRRAGEAHRAPSAIFVVVCPATVLHHWLQEFHHWAPFVRAVVLHSISATAAELLKVGNEGELCRAFTTVTYQCSLCVLRSAN
jgi:SNF2 family DNA or RNA helicase